MNEMDSSSLNTNKSPNEIKKIINDALVKNEIRGYLHNNLLYMQLFGKNNSLDKIFLGIGIAVIVLGTQINELQFMQGVIILTIGIGSFAISSILRNLLKYYLVYDTNREVFYTITNIKNKTFSKSNEIHRRDIIQLGVNTTFKDDNNNRAAYEAVHFKGSLKDNPGIRTFFVALKSNGQIVNISDPDGSKNSEVITAARCKLFAECFGLDYLICEKGESLSVVNEGKQKFKLSKSSFAKDLEKVKNATKYLIIFVIAFFTIMLILVFSLVYFTVGSN